MLTKLPYILAFLFVVACQGFAQVKDDAPLKQLVGQLVDAQTKYDAAALDRLFTADYIEISPLGEFDPRNKVLGFYKAGVKARSGKVFDKLRDVRMVDSRSQQDCGRDRTVRLHHHRRRQKSAAA